MAQVQSWASENLEPRGGTSGLGLRSQNPATAKGHWHLRAAGKGSSNLFPTSCLRLVSFSVSPIGWAQKKTARKGGGGMWPPQRSLGTEQREEQDHSGWTEGYFYLLYSSSEDPLSHLNLTGIRSVGLWASRKWSLPTGQSFNDTQSNIQTWLLTRI